MSQPVRMILCPVDFSSASEEAARYAVGLAERIGAKRVVFLHVFQRPVYPVSEVAGTFVDATAEEAIKESLRRQLVGLAKRHSQHGIDCDARLLEGFPYPTINDAADEEGADLIVMATHGRSGLGHFLLGSVAEKIIRTSAIPVCTVRVRD